MEEQSRDRSPMGAYGSPQPPQAEAPTEEEQEITDPIKLSYLRMKQQMELYGSFPAKIINFRAAAEVKEEFAWDTQTVQSQIDLQKKEVESDNNGDSAVGDIPLEKKSTLQLRKKSGLHLALDTPSAPPAAALVSLRAARRIKDFKGLNYPAEVQSPGLSQHPVGDFKYKKDFLMQFENVFTEKPCINWDEKVIGLFGDGAPLPPATRTTMGLSAAPSAKTRTSSGLPPRPKTSLQGKELPKATHEPERGTTDTHFGVDITKQSPRPGNRSSRGSRKGRSAIGLAEPEQRDDPKDVLQNDVLPTAGFGGFFKNDTFEREIVPIPDKPPYTAHIGNLNFEITTQEVSDFFEECGVKIVRLVRDKVNDHPKGFGYVEFNTKEGLIAATKLNGVQVFGRNIRISIARPPKQPRTERPTSGGWRDAAPTHPGPSVDSPVIGLSAVVRALEESGGRWRPTPAERPPVDRAGGWRNTIPESKEPSNEKNPKWDCVTCGISVDSAKKEAHLGGLRHAAKLKKQPQQHSSEGSPSARKGERRRSSLMRDRTAEEDDDVDPWLKLQSEGASIDCDWES